MKEILEITLDKYEAYDLFENLLQCESEGYLNCGDPCYSVFEILKNFLQK